MRRKLQLFKGFFLIGLLCLGFHSFAQETTSSLSGLVKDKSGPLPGVTIIAIHLPSGTQYATTTRTDGHYNIANVRVGGPYQITASYIGYKPEKISDITTVLGQTFKVNIDMAETSKQLQEVIVTGKQDKTINTSRTGAQDIFTRSNIERLPTVNRSLNDYTRLSPTANSSQNYGSNSIAGRSNLYNNSTVNGISFNNSFGLSGAIGGQVGVQPISIDAIEQVQVSISPYDVTQGSFTGAGINSITKAGTNSFSGMAYVYFKGLGLTGKYAGSIKAAQSAFTYHLDGFSVGGPIIKNKLFFFLNAEQERRSDPAVTYSAARAGGPAPNGAGSVSSANADTLNRLASFLKTKYDYDPGSYENYTYKTYGDRITLRLDYNINKNNTINGNFFYLKSYKDTQVSNSTLLNGSNTRQANNPYTLPFSGSGYRINNKLASGLIELNTRFSNQMSNKAQIGYTAMRDVRNFLTPGNFPLVTVLYGADLSTQLSGAGVTGIQPNSTYTSFGSEPFTYNNLLNSNIYQLNDIFSLFKGNHELSFGTQNQYQTYKNGFSQFYNGEYLFSSLNAFYANANGIPNAPSPAGYQLSYSGKAGSSFPYASLKSWQFSLFAQDKWNVNDRFKLTFGLRAEMYVIPTSSFTANPNVPGLSLRNGQTISSNQAPNKALQVLPRVGFNYDVRGDHSFQIRGGAGLFAGPPPMVWLSNQASNNGILFGKFTAQQSSDKKSLLTPSGQPISFNPDPNAYRPESGSSLPTSYEVDVTDKKFKFPQIFRADVAVDYKLPLDIVATLEGLYTKDVNAVYFKNLNVPTDGTALVGPDNRTRYSKATIYGSGSNSINNSASAPTAASPNLGSGVIYLTNTSKGYTYNIIVQAQRNVKGWYLMAAYTHGESKAVGSDNNSTAFSSWSGRQVSGDPNADQLGYSLYNQPDRIIAATSYRISYASHFATSVGFTYEAANNGVGSYTYNEPSSVAGGLNNDGVSSNDLIYVPRNQSDINLVDLVTTVKDKGGNIVSTNTTPVDKEWANLNAFIEQDKYLRKRRGQYAERNGALGPWYHRVDMNFSQDFYLTTNSGKRNTLRFTADIYNFTNLLNRDWGLYRGFSNLSPITLAGVKDNKPSYTFSPPPGNSSYLVSTAQASRYQIQLGIKYIFN